MVQVKSEEAQTRYGIAELFGYLLDSISEKDRIRLLDCALNNKVKEYPECPFRLPVKKGEKRCSKKGGVCSIRKYINQNGNAVRLDGQEGSLTVTCPFRFHQDMKILKSIKNYSGQGIPFPAKVRRPDYRSSAPKRLMPQLQIKVPALRRWGKKMAVVVDRHFFEWMGKIEMARDLTSSDIVWFVVDFQESAKASGAEIFKHAVSFTTLERAVEGLTGGLPVSLQVFEDRIKSNSPNSIMINISETNKPRGENHQ